MNDLNIKNSKQNRGKHNFNENFFEQIDTEEKAYWLGFMYADGCITRCGGGYNISLQVAIIDKNHLEKFKKAINSNHPIIERIASKHFFKDREINSSGSVRIRLCNKKTFEFLSKLGCVQRKSLILEFPNENQVPERLQNHFIRGFFDGNGSVFFDKLDTKNKGLYKNFRIDFCSTFNFLTKLKGILCKKACSSNIKVVPSENKVFHLKYGGNQQCLRLFEWMYKDATVSLDRKRDKFSMLEEQGVRNIKKEENHFSAKEFIFWNPDGNICKIKNILHFCRLNTQYKYYGFYSLVENKISHYKGWTNYKEGKKWIPAKRRELKCKIIC